MFCAVVQRIVPIGSNAEHSERRGWERLFEKGRNVWRVERSRRAAFLVDAAAYFAAFASAAEQARESILIVGWDIDSRVRLRRDETRRALPDELGEFLNEILRRRPGLHANVIDWNWAMLYALEREALPLLKLGWRTHERLHFRLDGNHPVGASHHQKIVVIDDALAFVGGLDLTARRWDTPEHRVDDRRRTDPWGNRYRPFHDVQLMVDGEAAAALGELVRERWRKITGESLDPPRRSADRWPEGVTPDLENVQVALSRTEPGSGGGAEAREVERLHLDAIAAARDYLYFETQYLTSATVGEALARRLASPEGPEVVAVSTLENQGWLEEATMGVLRSRLLRKLREADRYHRFRVYYPVVPGLGDDFLKMHAKVTIADDRFVRVGSSNLNNRSMGLDTELDLAIEAGDEARGREGIARLRNRLLGEHLGVGADRFGETVRQTGSLIAAIERLRSGERTLQSLGGEVPQWLDDLVPDGAMVDPERPVEASRLIDQMVGRDVQRHAYGPFLRGGLVLLVAVAFAAGWRYGPLGEWLRPEALAEWVEPLRESALGPLAVLLGYVLGGFAVFPVTVLILATILVFGPALGLAYAMAGSLLSASATYAAGRWLGGTTARTVGGSRLHQLSRRFKRGGLLPVAAVRAVPIAPFTVVNLAAGAMRIPFRPYLIGTFLGMLPGMLALTAFGAQLVETFRQPRPGSLVVLVALGAALVAASLWLRRRLGADGDER